MALLPPFKSCLSCEVARVELAHAIPQERESHTSFPWRKERIKPQEFLKPALRPTDSTMPELQVASCWCQSVLAVWQGQMLAPCHRR